MQRFVVATHNAHKTDEIRAVLEDLPLDVLDLTSLDGIPAPEETGDTFEANARLKALNASAKLPGALVLADDSGLEVDALGGAPGVYSSRFAGPGATDEANRRRLLTELGDRPDREARFRCVMVLVKDHRVLAVAEGRVEGRIRREESGSGGFGYDALFEPEGHSQTFSELDGETKNRISHRGRALERIRSHLPGEIEPA